MKSILLLHSRRFVQISFVHAFFLCFVMSCGEGNEIPVPTKDEIRSRYGGNYCTPIDDLDLKPNYRLELKPDSTYKARKTVMELGQLRRSVCSGKYSFQFDTEKKEWHIIFEKGERKRYDTDQCEGKRLLWSGKNGYAGDTSAVTIPELFDQFAIRKGNCEI